MKITAIGLGKPFYNSPKNYGCKNKAFVSAPQTRGADIFCFKGSKLSDKIGIVSTAQPTELERNIEQAIGIQPIDTTVKKFANGETYVNIAGDMRGKDIYLMPANNPNVNDNLMETYLKADAAKRAGAKKVIAVMPNFDYARQEKKTEAGEPIAAKLNMDLLKTSGVDELITEDFHTLALEGFASRSMPVTHLESMPLMRDYLKDKGIKDMVIVSPDAGGIKRADKLAKALDCEKAIIYKHREKHNEAIAEDVIGDVKDKNCVLYDDLIDTAGTITEASKLLRKKGAKDIYIFATHGLFNGSAMQKIESSPVKEVVVTNSVPKKPEATDKIKQLDISAQIVEAMKSISA
ncbi:ribose-phosphate pyrophosphokinase [bacterium]|nr:ribose-phosphate pyrophosphokinase [bacterium]